MTLEAGQMFTGGGWLRVELDWLLGTMPGDGSGVFGALGGGEAWPRGGVLMFLRLLADRAIWRGARFPSRRQIAARVGWTDGRVRTLLRHEEEWIDPFHAARWEQVRPAHRKAGPSTDDGAPSPQDGAAGGAGDAAPPPKAPAPQPTKPRRPIERDWSLPLRRFPTLRGVDAAELRQLVERVVVAIIGHDDPGVERVRAAAYPVLRLLALRAVVGEPLDLARFESDVELVAAAARECKHVMFRRYVRGEGLPDREDRSGSVSAITDIERWPERLECARQWRRLVDRAVNQAAPAAVVEAAPAWLDVGAQAWGDVLARLRRTSDRVRMTPELEGVALADHPAEEARRVQALDHALDVVHMGWTTLTGADQRAVIEAHEGRLQELFALFYGRPDPPT